MKKTASTGKEEIIAVDQHAVFLPGPDPELKEEIMEEVALMTTDATRDNHKWLHEILTTHQRSFTKKEHRLVMRSYTEHLIELRLHSRGFMSIPNLIRSPRIHAGEGRNNYTWAITEEFFPFSRKKGHSSWYSQVI